MKEITTKELRSDLKLAWDSSSESEKLDGSWVYNSRPESLSHLMYLIKCTPKSRITGMFALDLIKDETFLLSCPPEIKFEKENLVRPENNQEHRFVFPHFDLLNDENTKTTNPNE